MLVGVGVDVGVAVADTLGDALREGVGDGVAAVRTVSVFPATGQTAPATTVLVRVGVGVAVGLGEAVREAEGEAAVDSAPLMPQLTSPRTANPAPAARASLETFAVVERTGFRFGAASDGGNDMGPPRTK